MTDYLKGKLSRDRLDAVRAHLAECAECADYVEQMRTTVDMAARLRDAELQSRLRAVSRQADPGAARISRAKRAGPRSVL